MHGFLPVPSQRHRRYYRTSSSSFPGPYSVPPGVTSITLEKASGVKKHSVSLSASQVSSLETMLSGVCEVASWLDWWLSMCGGFREHLPVEVCAAFERLILSGSRALEFLASQGVTALDNLVLSRRDSLLADVRSTVPVEEVAHLRYSALPETVEGLPGRRRLVLRRRTLLVPLVLLRSSPRLLPLLASLVRRGRNVRVRRPFPHRLEAPEVKEKAPEEVCLTGCLSH